MNSKPQRHTCSAAPGTLAVPYDLKPTGASTRDALGHTGQRTGDIVHTYAPNIIIYGETGVGKSSIINLIAGRELAHTSNDALGCTFRHQRHIIELNGMSCSIWDTTGLDEGNEGTVPAAMAENNLKSLVQDLANTGGIHLVVYCIRAARHTKALQRNYDLFYVTVCRKKVPVALVVTGLEHQRGEMEVWWDENEVALRRYGMRFDAHVCVTTLDIEDQAIQLRRLHSQRLLRDLVVRYSQLPAWRADPSFLSSVLPTVRSALRKTIVSGSTKKSTIIRRAITCDMAPAGSTSTLTPFPFQLSPGTHLWATHTEFVHIEGRSYEFVSVDKRSLRMHNPQVQSVRSTVISPTAGVLVFYTSPLWNSLITQEEIGMLQVFYDVAGGHTCPMIVVLRGCVDEEQAIRVCQSDLASHHTGIQAYFTNSDERSNEMIGRLCIEHAVEVKGPSVRRVYEATKQLVSTIYDAIISMDCSRLR